MVTSDVVRLLVEADGEFKDLEIEVGHLYRYQTRGMDDGEIAFSYASPTNFLLLLDLYDRHNVIRFHAHLASGDEVQGNCLIRDLNQGSCVMELAGQD